MKTIYLTGAVTINEQTGEQIFAGEHRVSDDIAAQIAGNPRVKIREDKALTSDVTAPAKPAKARIETKA